MGKRALFLGLALMLLSYYGPSISDSFLAFPVGMILSLYHSEIKGALSAAGARKKSVAGAVLLGSICIFLVNFALPLLVERVPFILVTFSEDLLNTIIALSLILAFAGVSRIRFGVLSLVGVLSFELFLIHCLAMLKYDIVLWRGPVWVTFWPYAFIVLAAAKGFAVLVENLKRLAGGKAAL